VRGDICDAAVVSRVFAEHAPDTVIHFATGASRGSRAPPRRGVGIERKRATERIALARTSIRSSCSRL